MNNFYTFLKIFKGFVIAFLVLILAITIPAKLRENNYWQVLLIIVIAAFVLAILFALSFYFNSMAVNFAADAEYMFLTYADGKKLCFCTRVLKKLRTLLTNLYFIFRMVKNIIYQTSLVFLIQGRGYWNSRRYIQDFYNDFSNKVRGRFSCLDKIVII